MGMICIQQKGGFAIPPVESLHNSYGSVFVIWVTIQSGVRHHDYGRI